jgi:Uncharacterised nucleotidyltransferase
VIQNSQEALVAFLGYASNSAEGLARLRTLSDRKWRKTLTWLDDAGLALYFFDKLKRTGLAHMIPLWVSCRLEQCLRANESRIFELSKQFDHLNRSFRKANINYAVVKGFSLVPEYCPDANLRHQGDFDYLMDEESIEAAERIVLDAGYSAKPRRSRQELIFVKSGGVPPSRTPEQYSPRSPHGVELHLNMWNSDEHPLPEIRNPFSPTRTRTHAWNGFHFPALRSDDAFLLQVLHACQHLFTFWVRMSSLFEVGFFLHQHASDASLWSEVEQRIGEDRTLREFVVVITGMVAQLFAVPQPEVVLNFANHIRPSIRTWIDHYGPDCAFCEVPAYEFRFLPRAKLVLFLHQQYVDSCRDKRLVRTRLMKPARIARMIACLKAKPSLLLNRPWWKRQLLVRRSLFHALAGLRYLLEIPRWKWRNRTRTSHSDRPNTQLAGT